MRNTYNIFFKMLAGREGNTFHQTAGGDGAQGSSRAECHLSALLVSAAKHGAVLLSRDGCFH